jgi:phosphoglucomutase/phosphomannomutase
MITASHNPPSDNAIKAYWSNGGQLLPPHDKGVIDCVLSTETIHRMPLDRMVGTRRILYCQAEVDEAYIAAVGAVSFPGPRKLKILYSPLHGVGASAVLPVLARDGFNDVELFGPHASADGDFPNIPDHIANPENKAVFDLIIARAQKMGADLCLASDPDCDRVGLAAPLTNDPRGPWKTMTGNQTGALLTQYLLERWRETGRLTCDHYIVKTLVTSELSRRIADSYGIRTYGNFQVGFKYIAQAMDHYGPENFVFGMEESDGYLAGTYVRDKDAAVTSMLISQLAARVKAENQTLHHKLDELYRQYGYHAESQLSVKMPGSQGMKQMKALMEKLRREPPGQLGELKVTRVRDYESLMEYKPGEVPKQFSGPKGNLIMLDLDAEGTYVAIRPSGTEPKVKFYTFTYEPPDLICDLEKTKAKHNLRLASLATCLGKMDK